MNTVVLEVHSLASRVEAPQDIWTRRGERGARIAFATPELFWRVITAGRWQLLKAMRGAGPMSIREVAQRADRDVAAVRADVMELLDAGVLRWTAERQVEFPFDAVKLQFVRQAA